MCTARVGRLVSTSDTVWPCPAPAVTLGERETTQYCRHRSSLGCTPHGLQSSTKEPNWVMENLILPLMLSQESGQWRRLFSLTNKF